MLTAPDSSVGLLLLPRLSAAPCGSGPWSGLIYTLESRQPYVKLDRGVFLSGHVTSPITLGLTMLT